MKIGRIKEIKNIGTFANFQNGASLGFEKLTFIYGYNTYGKTTLADIFQSLKLNDSEIIRSRRTIPQQNISQKVVLTEKDQTEKDIKFKDGWNENKSYPNIEVFGTEFIHKNLFTGLTIERENRENFTHYVLGEQGVKIAEDIAEKRRTTGEMRRGLKTIIPTFVKNKTDDELKKFLQFSIQGLNKDGIDNDLLQKKVYLQNERERIKEPQKVLGLQEPLKYEVSIIDIISTIRSINTLLQEDYSNIKEKVLSRLNQHISTSFSNQDGAENWLKSGVHYCIDAENGNCPFCGQSLNNAEKLIGIYHSYFDPAYTEFINRIACGLSENIQKIEETYFSQKTELQNALTNANQFKTLIVDSDFQSKLVELGNTIAKLDENELNDKKKGVLDHAKISCESKNKSPYKKVKNVDYTDFNIAIESYRKLLITVEGIISHIRTHIENFKNSYRDTKTIQDKIDQLTHEIEELEYKKARIEQDGDCREYIKLQEEIDKLEEDIIRLQEQLKTEQSNYIENYFVEINALFKKLGSKNFILERVTDNTGHMPVYSLKIKFHGEDIPNNQLKTVFSDSDRRALALAIFWAKVNLKDNIEKARLIIILDDPVTSFDDNRITNSVNLFKDAIDKIDQMVILTHYPHFIKRFCEITKEANITAKFLKIEQDSTTSFLTESSRDDFTANDYERVFIKIYRFINKQHSESIKADLRPFFEDLYLPTVFAKQIRDRTVDCGSLESMIDGIFDDDEIKTKMHRFRTTLNPDSHLFTSNNNEDVRNFALEMMNYLYSLNFS